MAFCIKCGTEIPDRAEFCPKCGTRVGVIPKAEKKVSFGSIIEESFKLSMSMGNLLLVFVPMLLLFITLLQLGPQILLLIAENLPEISTGTVDIANFVITLLRMVSVAGVSILIYTLFSIYQRGVVIHNIGNKMIGDPKPYAQSLRMGFSRYPSIFITFLLLTILSILVGSVRYIGWILTLIVGCIFWVAYQGIILDGLGFADGLKRSYQYLRGYASPYIIAYIVAIILAIFLTVIGLIPMGIAVISLIPKMLALIPKMEPSEILRTLAFFLASPTIYIASVITCIIWTLNTLYTSYGIPTKLYLEIRGKGDAST